MTDEESLMCARVGIAGTINEMRARLSVLESKKRKNFNVRNEIERISGQLTNLGHSLERIDEVIDAMEKRRKASKLADASWQN